MKSMSRAGRRLVAGSVVFAAVAATGATAPATADTPSTISGTVSRADGGSPEGIVVVTRCNSDEVFPDEGTTTTTAAADGSYSFTDPAVPPDGECEGLLVEFHDPTGKYVSQFYDDTPLVDFQSTPVVPVPGTTVLVPQVLSHVGGAISGRVVDTYGHGVHDRDLQVRAGNYTFEHGIVPDPASLGRTGGFVLGGLPAGRYFLAVAKNSRYAPETTENDRKHWVRVAAGKTATAPRLVLKDSPRIQLETTWHARSVTYRVRVTSMVTGRPAAGKVSVAVLGVPGGGHRDKIRLRHGRVVVTLPAGSPRETAAMDVRYHGSQHVGARSQRRWHTF